MTVSSGVIPGVLPEEQDRKPGEKRNGSGKSNDGDNPFQYSKNELHTMTLSADLQRSSIGHSIHLGLRA